MMLNTGVAKVLNLADAVFETVQTVQFKSFSWVVST